MQGVLLLDDQVVPVRLAPGDRGEPAAVVARDGNTIWVHLDGESYRLHWRDLVTHLAAEEHGDGDAVARAPMPGTVIAIAVTAGDAVTAGQALLTIESMKLETVIRASRAGTVGAVLVAAGDTFERDAALVRLAEAD